MDYTQLGISIVNSLALVIIAYMTRRTEKNTNSMKDELVAITKKSSKAEGNLEGREELKQEQDEAKIFPPKPPPY